MTLKNSEVQQMMKKQNCPILGYGSKTILTQQTY